MRQEEDPAGRAGIEPGDEIHQRKRVARAGYVGPPLGNDRIGPGPEQTVQPHRHPAVSLLPRDPGPEGELSLT